ncbi:hypothetical protein PBY51_012399 [Eleginops maclovinus]|uniref:Uncharacterized protein n=1 Tax=Eleginops maclovinus TaxID=56733 RepID=A0AAN7XXH3_ELEMC|nr:hypothetical protein PBY51_012399 [Eleginops maclovinus]
MDSYEENVKLQKWVHEAAKYQPEPKQTRASEREGKVLVDKDLVPKLENEFERMLQLKQEIHDRETHLLDLRLQVSMEKCETAMIQKVVMCRAKEALLRQVRELCKGEEELQDLLQVKIRENEALQSEIQSLKREKNVTTSINAEQFNKIHEGWMLPSPHGCISWVTDHVCTAVGKMLLVTSVLTLGYMALQAHREQV